MQALTILELSGAGWWPDTDVCCDEYGMNAMEPKCFSARENTLQQDLRGRQMWGNRPFERLGDFTMKVEEAATADNTTRALLILPLRTGNKDFRAFLDRNYWDMLGLFPANAKLFLKPPKAGVYSVDRTEHGKCQEEIGVFTLKTRPDEELSCRIQVAQYLDKIRNLLVMGAAEKESSLAGLLCELDREPRPKAYSNVADRGKAVKQEIEKSNVVQEARENWAAAGKRAAPEEPPVQGRKHFPWENSMQGTNLHIQPAADHEEVKGHYTPESTGAADVPFGWAEDESEPEELAELGAAEEDPLFCHRC